MPNQGIDVGDAVFTFLANTTQLDASMTRVEAIPGRLTPARGAITGMTNDIAVMGAEMDATADNVENAGETIVNENKKVANSYREARGEAMLLGEATGIHLPRHVTSFLASMGGVQEVLSAAFTATAVLFLIEALIKGSEKLSEFISNTFIYTQAMKDADEMTKNFNAEVIRHNEAMKTLKRTYDELGLDSSRKLGLALGDIMKTMKETTAAIDELKKHSKDAAEEETGFWNATKNAARGLADNLLGTTMLVDHLADRQKKADDDRELAAKKLNDQLAEQKEQAAIKEKQIDDEVLAYEKKASDELRKIQFARFEEHQKQLIQAAADEKAFADVLKNMFTEGSDGFAKGLNEVNLFIKANLNVKNTLVDGANAAHALGITLQSDLIGQLQAAQKAYDLMAASGLVAAKDMKVVADQIKDLQKQIDNFDKSQPTVPGFKQIINFAQQASAAEVGFGDAYGKALAKVVSGEESFGAAMEKATGQFIEQIGERALVKGMFDLGQGFAAMAVGDGPSATAFFQASAIELAVGGAATAAGAAIAGSAGNGGSSAGGGSTGAHGGSVQTTGSGGSTGPNQSTRMMAGGGLVTGPTLAMIGEKPGTEEAVLPLNDDSAMSRIGKAISEQGSPAGGGHTFHVHVNGLVSPDNLTKVMKQMSERVGKGTAALHSSNTLRVTKRSQ